MYGFNGQEKDDEVAGSGNSYTAEYWQYDPRLGRRWNIDPVDQICVSNYATFFNNPIFMVDPLGNTAGDFYSENGKWLGSDGKDDNLAYVVHGNTNEFKIEDFQKGGKYENGNMRYNIDHTSITQDESTPLNTFDTKVTQTSQIELLPISNDEMLKRANWIYGESSGNGEMITDATIYLLNGAVQAKPISARVVDFYAHAINNAVKTDGSFAATLKLRMSRKENGVTVNTSALYFDGTDPKRSDKHPSKVFALARKAGMNNLMATTNASNAISAVIKSVSLINNSIDPTYGSRAWLGKGTDADPKGLLDGTRSTGVYFKTKNGVEHGFYKK